MSGSTAIPHPSTARTVVCSPGCGGRYVPSVHATESPKNVTLGWSPGVRPGRRIGGGRPDVVAPMGADAGGGSAITGTAPPDEAGSGRGATPTIAAAAAQNVAGAAIRTQRRDP